MADPGVPSGREPAARPEPRRPIRAPSRPIGHVTESLSIVPNLIATLVSLVLLLVAPLVYWEVVFVWVDAADVGQVGPIFLPAGLVDTVKLALAGSVLFLVLGVILQLGQLHRPFANGWPVVLAFPVAWILLLPEALLRGGSLLFW